jgi:hypothetical protein
MQTLRWVGALAVLQTTAGCSLDFDYLRGNGQGESAGDSGSQDAITVGVDATDGTPTADANGDSANDTTVALMDDGGAPDGAADTETGPDCNAGGPAGNLFQNWSFECGSIVPWGTLGNGGSIVLTTKHVHSGQYGSLTTSRTQRYQGPMQTVPLTPGLSYAASAYVYVESSLDGGAGGADPDAGPITINVTADVSCLVDGATSSNYIQVASVPITLDTWNYVAGSFVMPSCTVASAGIYVEGPPTTVDLYVDDLALLQ